MTAATATGPTAVVKRVRWKRLLVFGLVVVVIGAFADLLGWDITGWLGDVWDTITSITVAELVAATVLKTLQTTATAYAWYAILKYAYPTTRFRLVLACYATSVALNSILPANIGTLVMLLMFTTVIAGATFSGVLGAYVVEKIFFTLSGAFTYLYLFLTVGGSFDIKFGFVDEHPASLIVLLAGAAWLIYLLVRAFWPRVVKWWDEAKTGGEPRRDGRLPPRVRHPNHLPHADADLRRELDRQHDLGDARRRRRQPGVQRRFSERCDELGERDRLLRRAAALHDRLEHPLRDHPRHVGVRLAGRQGARRAVLRRRQGEGGGTEGRARGAEGSEEGAARRRRSVTVVRPRALWVRKALTGRYSCTGSGSSSPARSSGRSDGFFIRGMIRWGGCSPLRSGSSR
jgi:hypothetical protein